MKNQGLPYRERGSAIVYVFVMIALFGILTFAMNRGSRSTLGSLDREHSQLAASEIIGYGQSVREAAKSIKIGGCTDTQINFGDSGMGAGFNNPTAPTDDSCNVFGGAGGGISYYPPTADWLDGNGGNATNPHYGHWYVTGDIHVQGVGTAGNAGAGCVGGGSGCKELIFGLPFIHLNICKEINKKLNFGASDGTPPKDSGVSFAASSTVNFVGTYSTTGEQMGTATIPANSYSNRLAGCIEGDSDPLNGTYHYFQVILAR